MAKELSYKEREKRRNAQRAERDRRLATLVDELTKFVDDSIGRKKYPQLNPASERRARHLENALYNLRLAQTQH
jgi:hypothetical protein